MQNGLAPIVLFVYNRPEHTIRTLEALQKNKLSDQSILYIFSDGYKKGNTTSENSKVDKVREIISNKKWCDQVIINESDNNKGLATSIIEGVSKIINEYGKAIVLEDDLVTSSFFLPFMNEALSRYESADEVKQISGFIPLKIKTGISQSSFFLPVTTTWGWGSWKRVWNQVDFNPRDYKEAKSMPDFNLNGRIDYSGMLETQMESNKISSWGIRFWWDIFKKKGLVLYPDKSLVSNIGMDGTGTHNPINEMNASIDLEYQIKHYPQEISVLPQNYKSFLKYYTKPSLFRKLFK
jgi:hypothetical protein